jgi:phage baseplate assembly protein W
MKSLYFNIVSGDTELDELHNIKEITGKEELEQAIWMRLQTNRGEWIFDLEFGVPWMDLFESRASAEEFQAAIEEELNKEDRVIEVINVAIEQDIENRKLDLGYELETTEGLIESSGEVEI